MLTKYANYCGASSYRQNTGFINLSTFMYYKGTINGKFKAGIQA